jgi:hypothetical protein
MLGPDFGARRQVNKPEWGSLDILGGCEPPDPDSNSGSGATHSFLRNIDFPGVSFFSHDLVRAEVRSNRLLLKSWLRSRQRVDVMRKP